mmetsp:Transcript_29954/g.51457  ORF Transcript_29954/g.51457 Transcript_29954/m.51457 type:complete len:108 (+) Transcript_29954:94-417(+)
MAALKVLKDENMAENSLKMGERLRAGLSAIDTDLITTVRGRGLLSAIVVDDSQEGSLAMDMCMQLKDAGLLAKPTHGNIIRLAPPLCINEAQIDQAVDIVGDVCRRF